MKRLKHKRLIRFKIINLIDQKVTEISLYCRKNPMKQALNKIFKDHELIDCQRMFKRDKGHPDYMIKKGLYTLYVEFKSPSDSVHTSQIEWIFKNPNKKTIILHQLDY